MALPSCGTVLISAPSWKVVVGKTTLTLTKPPPPIDFEGGGADFPREMLDFLGFPLLFNKKDPKNFRGALRAPR
mgnify:CR=1 FL=1